MLKADLISLIKKYNLEGNCQSVKWSVKDKNLSIKFMTEDATLIGSLEANVEFEDQDFGIYDTDKLLSLLGALDNEINVDYHYERNKVVGLRLTDKVVSATYMLADLDIIPVPRERKGLPEFDIEISLKKDLIDRFIKSKKSLTDSKLVALIPDRDSVDFVINYSEQPTNRISLTFPAKVANQFNIAAFNVDYICNILAVNSDFKEANLKVTEKGMFMEFKDENYTSEYMLKSVSIS